MSVAFAPAPMRAPAEQTVGYNIEFAHVYADAIDTLTEDFFVHEARSLRMAKTLLHGTSSSVSVMVDDYETPVDRPAVVRQLTELFRERDISVDWFAFEADCARAVPVLLRALPPRAVRRAQEHVHFLKNGIRASSSVLLAEPHREIANETYYSCGALATVWYLARFGIEPYRDALTLYPGHSDPAPFWAERLLTVLPSKYVHVESTVLDLIASMNPKKLRALQHRVGYVFYPER